MGAQAIGDWPEEVKAACRRFGNSCHDLPEHLQDGCLRTAHPQNNYSNWQDEYEPDEWPETSFVAIQMAENNLGKWITGKNAGPKNNWAGYVVCQLVESAVFPV